MLGHSSYGCDWHLSVVHQVEPHIQFSSHFISPTCAVHPSDLTGGPSNKERWSRKDMNEAVTSSHSHHWHGFTAAWCSASWTYGVRVVIPLLPDIWSSLAFSLAVSKWLITQTVWQEAFQHDQTKQNKRFYRPDRMPQHSRSPWIQAVAWQPWCLSVVMETYVSELFSQPGERMTKREEMINICLFW